VTLVKKHLRGEVFGGTAERVGTGLTELGETEIRELEVAFLINQNVFGFEITVNNMLRVEVLEHQRHLGRVKHSVVRLERSFSSEESEKLTTGNVLHEEVEVAMVLRKALKSD